MKIENAVGEAEQYPHLAERRQFYLFAVAALALESALIKQVADMQAHYLPKVSGELAKEWALL